jgi:hypothetical protein
MNAFLLQTGGTESIKPQLEVKNKYKKEKESIKNKLSPIGFENAGKWVRGPLLFVPHGPIVRMASNFCGPCFGT